MKIRLVLVACGAVLVGFLAVGPEVAGAACMCFDNAGCDVMECNEFGVECDAGFDNDSLESEAGPGSEGYYPSGSCAVKEQENIWYTGCHYNMGVCGGPDVGDGCVGS